MPDFKTGCAANSRSPAPDVTGWWDVNYDDTLGVRITIGGAVYETELGAGGGAFTIDHDGQPITFDLDCDRPEILCPSEAWPLEVYAEQRVGLNALREVYGPVVTPDPLAEAAVLA